MWLTFRLLPVACYEYCSCSRTSGMAVGWQLTNARSCRRHGLLHTSAAIELDMYCFSEPDTCLEG